MQNLKKYRRNISYCTNHKYPFKKMQYHSKNTIIMHAVIFCSMYLTQLYAHILTCD